MNGTPRNVELITIGDELLLGDIVDGNSMWLGQRLSEAGFHVVRRTTVGDDVDAIRDAVAAALDRTGTVLCTGGLGPTSDDVTRPTVAGLFGRDLVLDTEVLDAIRARFRARGMEMPELNRVQAEVPVGARVLPNALGTAPGLVLEDERGRVVVLLPGVPREMRALVDTQVIPLLQSRWNGANGPPPRRRLRTTGIPESELAENIADLVPRLDPVSIAFLPTNLGVDLRLTLRGAVAGEPDAERALDAAEREVAARLGPYIYAYGDDDLAEVVCRELARRGGTLAVAESCTGGLIAKRITDPPGASATFLGGVVAYSNRLKETLLGVRRSTLEVHGAVSAQTAREMVDGIRRITGATAALSVTGIAGPSGGSPDKPVGTVWIGAALEETVEVRNFVFVGTRKDIRERSAQAALALLLRLLRR